MNRVLACLSFLLLGLALLAQDSANLVTLPKDTEIKLKMAQTLTSKHAYVGERVELVVADDVIVDTALLVPKGTRVLGTVKLGKLKEGDKNNPHSVVIEIDYVRLGERRIPLTGMHSDKGKVNKGGAIAGAIFLGLSGVLLAMDAATAQIKEGTEITALVAGDVALPYLGARPSPSEKPAEASTPTKPAPASPELQ